MAWDSKYVNYGVAKVEGDKVKVYHDKFSATTISVGKPIKYAIWAGNELCVYLLDGKVRRYKDQFSYVVI